MNQSYPFSFTVCEKPHSVTWDEIQSVIYIAHTDVSKQGGVQVSAQLTGAELQKKIGDAKCYVAMLDGRVIGTCTVSLRQKNAWFNHGTAAYYMLDAVLPEFQGFGVYSELEKLRKEYVRKHGVSFTYLYTSETNTKLQSIYLKRGFKHVSYAAFPNTDYYSVIMAKWLDGCPFPNWYCRLRYYLSKLYIKTRYGVGLVKRF